MLRLFKDHLNQNKESLTDMMLGGAITPERLQDIAQLRGGILTLEQMLNIKEYLLDLVEDYPNEEDKNEVSSIRQENTAESKEV